MRKSVIISVAIVAAIIAVTGAYYGTQSLAPRPLVKLHFGESFPSPEYHLPFLVGMDKGIFQKYGVEVESTIFKGGTEQSQAIAAGQVKLGFIPASRATDLKANGVPIKIIGTLFPKTSFVIVVARDSPIKSPQDMNGKNFGVAGLRGLSATYAEFFNDYYKVKSKLVAVGDTQPGVALLLKDQVQAYTTSVCSLAPFLAKGDVRTIVDLSSTLPQPWVDHSIFALEDLLNEKPEAVKNFMKALDESIQFMMKNREYGIDQDTKFYNRERQEAAMCLNSLTYQPGLKLDPNGLKNTLDFLVQYRALERGRAELASQLIDTRFT